jgi:hypothetical protein
MLLMARKKNSEFDPIQHFSLNDISLWATSLTREEDYDPAKHKGKCLAQTFQNVEPLLYNVKVEGDEEEALLLRVFVELGVRSVFREVEDLAEGEVVVFTLEATFAADYFVIRPPAAEGFNEFVNFNCVHNVWPFWRQHVHDTLRRAALPILVVPLFAGKTYRRPKKITSPKRLSLDEGKLTSK